MPPIPTNPISLGAMPICLRLFVFLLLQLLRRSGSANVERIVRLLRRLEVVDALVPCQPGWL